MKYYIVLRDFIKYCNYLVFDIYIPMHKLTVYKAHQFV